MSFLGDAEERVEEYYYKAKKVLPAVGRTLMVATFLEDGLRMWMQWSDQAEYLEGQLPGGWFVVFVFILLNFSFQLVGGTMAILKKRTEIAVGMLFAVIVMQVLAYKILWGGSFFLRNLALIGGLVLLLAEAHDTKKIVFAGVPTVDTATKKTYMQLMGRILLVFMFFTLVHWDMGWARTSFSFVGLALVILVAVGFKTKLSALTLAVFLTFSNFYVNAFWTMADWNPQRDFLKYDFFQTLSVIGGLFLVVALGGGDMSVDAKKKKDF